jgi:DNA-directed RNA polymerase subunit RPC12/RpoP
LRLAGGEETWILILQRTIVVLAFPMIVLFAYRIDLLKELVGTRCPSCHWRELGRQSGNWKYGDPPDYEYFACANCGASFKLLRGGQGVLSDFEPTGRNDGQGVDDEAKA